MVLNHEDIRHWAENQGIQNIMPDLHVTIAYSRAPVDWDVIANSGTDEIRLPPTIDRSIKKLGENCTVLVVKHPVLTKRHKFVLEQGGSYDYPDYIAHVTLTEDEHVPHIDTPYHGLIVLGREILDDIRED